MNNAIAVNYRNSVIGRKIDVDGFPKGQPYQCVDLFKHFMLNVIAVDPGSVCPKSGFALDIWTEFEKMAKVKPYFIKIPANQMHYGDWTVFKRGGVTPDSHVAMFIKDNGNGTGLFLGGNQGTVKNGKPAVNEINISYTTVYGALRPNIYSKVEEPIKKYFGTPVSKDRFKNQTEIKVNGLNIRNAPNGTILGYANPGIYNFLQTRLDGNYMWYEIEADKWVAHRDEWLNVFVAEKEEIKEDPILIAELENKVKSLQELISEKDMEIERLNKINSDKPKPIFKAPKNSKYRVIINLKESEIIYK